MRKVFFSYYEKAGFTASGKTEKLENVSGLFHCWGASYEEFESGAGNYTVAIIELANGRIVEAFPTDIIFI